MIATHCVLRASGGTVWLMLANVRYRGLAVVEGARISRGEGEDKLGPFIELDPPFPVGTTLAVELVREGKVEARTVRVRRVHEGLPSGIFITFTDGAEQPTDLPTRPQAALAAAADEAPKPAPVAAAAAPAPKPAATTILEEKLPEPVRDERRNRPTEPVPIYTQTSFPDVDARDTAPSIPAIDADGLPAGSDTQEMAVVSMDAGEPEDEAPAKGADSKAEENRRGGRKNRKRSKTVIGH